MRWLCVRRMCRLDEKPFNSLFEMHSAIFFCHSSNRLTTFNSLFEMQNNGGAPPGGLRPAEAFNSLFEMQLPCQSARAPRTAEELSILYLRCL